MAEFGAPAGFAATVASDLLQRARSYNAQNLERWSDWVEPRTALMTELAVLVAGRGDRDDLISALAAFDSGRWTPGRRVEALLTDSILVVPDPSGPGYVDKDRERLAQATADLPNAHKLLHRLVAAYMSDVVEQARRMRDRAASELAAAAPDARVADLEMRVAVAEKEAASANAQVASTAASAEQLMQQNGLMRAELRLWAERTSPNTDPDDYVAAILRGLAPEAGSHAPAEETGAPEAVAPLPPGIRERENGRYHAYLTRAETAEGKQRGVGTFETIEEAVAAREAALALESQAEEIAA